MCIRDRFMVSQEWTVTVGDVNRPPTIDSFTPVSTSTQVYAGGSLPFTHLSSDPDEDSLTYSWLLEGVEQATTLDWTYLPGYDSAGLYNVTLAVSDGEFM